MIIPVSACLIAVAVLGVILCDVPDLPRLSLPVLVVSCRRGLQTIPYLRITIYSFNIPHKKTNILLNRHVANFYTSAEGSNNLANRI